MSELRHPFNDASDVNDQLITKALANQADCQLQKTLQSSGSA